MNDPYEIGTPKYSNASDIYDALRELTLTEEMQILLEIGIDVSYEQQTYYYTDKGCDLKEEFEELSDHGDKMWLLDLAIYQLDGGDVHDWVYRALCNTDLAKRIGFKKLFIDCLLRGDSRSYSKIAECFTEELSELDHFGYIDMVNAVNRVINECEMMCYHANPYPDLSGQLYEKICGLKLDKEKMLIVECRSLLTSYDDFIYGLRANQALFKQQERAFNQKKSELQAAYEKKTAVLLATAEKLGIPQELLSTQKLIEE